MMIAVPVECQNGHKAMWYFEINGLAVRTVGVPITEKCNCPKWSEGQGYHATGKPEVVSG